jgi:hypothetical protein
MAAGDGELIERGGTNESKSAERPGKPGNSALVENGEAAPSGNVVGGWVIGG